MLKDPPDYLDWRDLQDPRVPMGPQDLRETEDPVVQLDRQARLESCLCCLQTFCSRETLPSPTETREKPVEMPSIREHDPRRTATWI